MHSSCTQHHILFVYVFFLKWLIDIVNFYLFLQSINFQNFLVLVGLWTTNPQFFPYLTMNRVKLIGSLHGLAQPLTEPSRNSLKI